MNMIKFEKIQDLITRLEKIDGHISFVDGKTYVISCPVGGYFVYDKNECIEISRAHFEQLDGKLKNTFSVISRKDLDGDDTYPIKFMINASGKDNKIVCFGADVGGEVVLFNKFWKELEEIKTKYNVVDYYILTDSTSWKRTKVSWKKPV